MAATLVGGAFLSATVQTLVEKLASTEFRDYIKNKKLNVSLLEEMETRLLALLAVLDDAEQKQINNPAVKQWLDKLKDAVFDAEDLLNEISYDSLRCKGENTQAGNTINQVWKWNFLSSPFKSFYAEINSQMKTMCQRLQLFAQQRDIFGLQTVNGRVSRRTPSSSIVNESIMVGRKDDKEELMSMLLSQRDTGSNNMGVIAILGMGGVGKTTLAQLLYNDKEVQERFDLKAWACVSEDYDILRVTKTLLESVTSRACERDDLDFLRLELKKNLRDRRFLFVLDDLWNDNYNDWDELMTPFIHGKSGSRVIITTRQQKVAEVTRTFPIHKLEPLSDEDCWSLLSKHAFGGENFCDSKYPNLQAIGRKIARKCGGLPIAAKTLGGLLRSKVDAKQWIEILNSEIWNLPNDNILPALFLSYQYLPSYLKICFAYCSIFPKDYTIDRKQLVLLWMAEGFLEHSQGERAAEEVGDDCFAELLSRSLVQQSNEDVHRDKFVMHDLVNDLATVISGKSCCRLECIGNISKNVRHLSYNQELYDIFKKFEIFYDFKCLRSFLPIGPHWRQNYLSTKVVDDLLPSLHRLRVLSLSGYINITMLPNSVGELVQLRYLDLSYTRIKSLPDTICNLYNLQTLILSSCITVLSDSVGELVQLRYLDLSSTEIESLPDTICNLYNLQTLILSCCSSLTELPIHMEKLISLRHLDIRETNIKEMPLQIVRLENLQTLTVFTVGKREAGLSVRELGRFPNLQGKLCIKNLHNVIDAMEVNDANLKSKEQIEELVLEWGKQTEDSQTEKVVLDMLQPSVNLKNLTIKSYGGTAFPSWFGYSSFSNVVFLSIQNCEYCVTLPPVGQLPSLKKLLVNRMGILETIGPEFYGMAGGGSNSSFQPFPSLEELHFFNMPNWKEWLPFEGGNFPFPRLKSLELNSCPELKGHLPSHFSSIEIIEIINCHELLATPPNCSEGSTERTQWSLFGSDSLCLLQHVSIRGCDTLLYLPKMIMSSTCLQHLELTEIPSLTSFPANGLPTSLKSLRMLFCENLSFLPPETWSNYTSLVHLTFYRSCDALTSFPLDGFPALQILDIHGCRSLESIFISESSSSSSSSSLHSSTPLQLLAVSHCKSLRSLPQRMDTLTALEFLDLIELPELESPIFEGACLPPKLRIIHIESVRIATPVLLKKERLLPISLVSLSISGISEMKSLVGNGLRHLSSLETLRFSNCSVLESLSKDTLPSSLKTLEFWSCARLESLSEDTLPSSLKTLQFGSCPRLESFPEHSLPSSLKRLHIYKCPMLEERYGNERGEHWSNIAHIPVIEINGKVTI